MIIRRWKAKGEFVRQIIHREDRLVVDDDYWATDKQQIGAPSINSQGQRFYFPLAWTIRSLLMLPN